MSSGLKIFVATQPKDEDSLSYASDAAHASEVERAQVGTSRAVDRVLNFADAASSRAEGGAYANSGEHSALPVKEISESGALRKTAERDIGVAGQFAQDHIGDGAAYTIDIVAFASESLKEASPLAQRFYKQANAGSWLFSAALDVYNSKSPEQLTYNLANDAVSGLGADLAVSIGARMAMRVPFIRVPVAVAAVSYAVLEIAIGAEVDRGAVAADRVVQGLADSYAKLNANLQNSYTDFATVFQ